MLVLGKDPTLIDGIGSVGMRDQLYSWRGRCRCFAFKKLSNWTSEMYSLVHDLDRMQNTSSEAQEQLRLCLEAVAAECMAVERSMKLFYKIDE